MNKVNQIPLRAKLDIVQEIAEVICLLHKGDQEAADKILKEMKIRSIFLDEEIQRNVLIFAEQVDFQYDYDPWHKVTPDVQRAADQLINSLGLNLKNYPFD
jgi:hypothetical protein